MPRSNRRREEQAEFDLERALVGRLRTETKRDGVWNVQPQAASSAVKSYLCPGCGLEIEPGTPNVVTWRADGIMGEADDLAARRHWHVHCWKIRG
ncbi:MAG TPA: hypothetical protein VNS80_03440 [Pseudolysinimonas sp.]|nr:hypothetical protein [Pseudolysinimonas sp.]